MSYCLRRRTAQALLLFLLLSVIVVSSARAGEGQLLWQVSSRSGTAYLLGSIHFGKPDMYPLAPAVMDAFAESDALVVEANIMDVDPVMVAQMVAGQGMYTDGSSLKNHIEPETWQALSDAAMRYGVPVELFQAQKPWLASVTLVTLALKHNGYSEGLGIDRYFMQRANKKKPIIELESISRQFDLFASLSEAEQGLFLSQTLKEVEQGGEYLDTMMGAWKNGDAAEMDSVITASFRATPGTERFYKLVFLDRNNAMTTKIQALLKEGKTYFIVVGAGHLVGKNGIVELLRQKGYQIRAL